MQLCHDFLLSCFICEVRKNGNNAINIFLPLCLVNYKITRRSGRASSHCNKAHSALAFILQNLREKVNIKLRVEIAKNIGSDMLAMSSALGSGEKKIEQG